MNDHSQVSSNRQVSDNWQVSNNWAVYISFLSMSLLHFRRNGVGLAMTLAIPLVFLLLYGYSYLLSTPQRTITVGLLPAAVEAHEWRAALPGTSFKIKEIQPEKIADHLREGDPPLILDRDLDSGKAIIHAAPYWRPAAELMVRAIDGVPTSDGALEGRVHAAAPGHAPFFMLPAIMVMALLNVGLFTAGAKILQERARGTLRMFRMLPVSIGWYFAAELVTKLMIALVLITGYLGIAILMFDLELSWWQTSRITAASLLLASVFIAMGLALACILRSHATGIHAFTVCNLLIIFLGDLFFNASRFPITKWISLLLPTPYGMDLMRHSMFETPLYFPAAVSVSILFAWLIVMMAIAIWTFNYKARE